MVRFTHVTLENWKNFTRIDVDLQLRAFLVGPNAAGKSNFLDVFRFLHDLVAVGGGFQAAVQQRGGVSSIRSLAARRNPEVAVQVALGEDGREPAWRYELRFTQDNRSRPVIRREVVERAGERILERPDGRDRSDEERLTQTYLEQVYANQPFRDVADFFQSVRYLHIVPHLVRDPDRSLGRSNDPYGGDFLEQIARTPERTRSARLRRIRDPLRVAVPQLRDLELTRDVRGTPHLRGTYEHWRAQGAWQTEDQFSDGTLRLMGLMWAALDGSGPLLLEEPELSLHPEVVRFIPQLLWRTQRRSGRQMVVSTHSRDLLGDEGIGLDELLLLKPTSEGTGVSLASDDAEIRVLLEGGLSLADAIGPHTSPARTDQLIAFGT